jgi:3-oxoadipate enol-lactonase
MSGAAKATSGIAPVGDVELHYAIDFLDDSAGWIVFSNSLMTDLSIWDDQVAALGARHNILRYDQAGHGGSTLPPAPLDFDILGGHLLALLDRLGIVRCVAVGLSMGVPTVLSAWRIRPSVFAGMVVVDGQARTAATGRQTWEERIAFARAEGMSRMAEDVCSRWLQQQARGDGRGERLRAMVAATPIAGFEACARVLQDYDLSDVVPRLDVPLLAVAGACDGVMPETMRNTFGVLPLARHVEIEAAGHVPNLERPEQFNTEILRFLSDPSFKINN